MLDGGFAKVVTVRPVVTLRRDVPFVEMVAPANPHILRVPQRGRHTKLRLRNRWRG